MGIFNRLLGGRDDDAALRQQEGEVLQALNAANRDREQASRRLAAVLDVAAGAMLLADENHCVTHANAAMLQMLRTHAADLRLALSSLSVDAMVGSKLEVLYPSSILQRNVFDALTDQRSDDFVHGSHHCRLIVSPVYDPSRRRIGTLLEWQDRGELASIKAGNIVAVQNAEQAVTARLSADIEQVKKELERLGGAEKMFQQLMSETVEAAANGDLGKRIATTQLHGVTAELAGKLNTLLAGFEQLISDVTMPLDALSGGVLTHRVTQNYQGSFAVLKNAINSTIDKLVSVVREIQSSAVQVKTGAVDINCSNMNLSSRTEQQAASLEETAAAMEEITTTVQQNAANAIQANNLARAARETAENGGQVVSKAVAAMQAISESSSKINEIIGVIDEIAFQTNLLALNAAVEAARAGDQGRGFAVVADEVRNLAGRSAKAAKEIKDLIKDSGEKVREGSNLVNKSGQTLDEIVTAVKKVNDIVAEISTASDEQATGLEEIKRSVCEMDAMTQENAAMVEQANAAGKTLGEEANALENMIAFFDTGAVATKIVKKEPPARAAPPTRKPATSSAPARHSIRPPAKLPLAPATAAKPLPTSRPAVAAKAAVAARPPVAAKPATAAKPAARVPVSKRHDDEDKNWAEF